VAQHPHHDHKHSNPAQHSKNRGLHKDWRAWLVVLIMLAAMVIYVMSDNESLRPSGAPEAPMPAAVPAPPAMPAP
jgi:hypothetical protein